MKSSAKTVPAYLASLPPDRRAGIQAVRAVILKNLDRGYAEGMQYGMIGYAVPHSVYPDGYHCDPTQPLPFVALGSQKNNMAVYLMCFWGSPELRAKFESDWKKTGKKLDAGKSCIRFKKVDDLALDVLGDAIKRMPAKKFIAAYERMRAQASNAKAKAPAKRAGKPAAARKPARRT